MDPKNYCMHYNYILLPELEFALIMLTEEKNVEDKL